MPQRAHMSKHLRQTEGRTYRNRLRKKTMKGLIREVVEAAEAGDAEAVETGLPTAFKAIDKAASRGVIHKHTAARRKSRLTARVRTIAANA